MVLKPPYQYVIDTSALIDLKDQYPEKIFTGLWDRFNEMCEQAMIIAPREVLREIKRGDDYLIEWVKNYDSMFLEPCDEEVEIFQRVYADYNDKTKQKYSTGPWADPLVISCAKYYQLPIIQQELYDMNSFKIPKIAKLHNVECLRLVEFFAGEGWSFQ